MNSAQLLPAIRDLYSRLPEMYDLDREAAALNRGRKAPKPKEPELRSQLEGAQREIEVLERRLVLAGSDRSRYIQEHGEELMRLLAEAQAAAKGRR